MLRNLENWRADDGPSLLNEVLSLNAQEFEDAPSRSGGLVSSMKS